MFKTVGDLYPGAVDDCVGNQKMPVELSREMPTPPTALFADTDPENRETYAWLLSSYGFQVRTAGSGLECVEKLCRFIPDLMVLDVEMPWGGGDGVLQAIRKEPWLLPSRVVLTISRGSLRRRLVRGWPPWVRCLSKPFPLWKLIESAFIEDFMAREPVATG